MSAWASHMHYSIILSQILSLVRERGTNHEEQRGAPGYCYMDNMAAYGLRITSKLNEDMLFFVGMFTKVYEYSDEQREAAHLPMLRMVTVSMQTLRHPETVVINDNEGRPPNTNTNMLTHLVPVGREPGIGIKSIGSKRKWRRQTHETCGMQRSDGIGGSDDYNSDISPDQVHLTEFTGNGIC